MNFGNDSNEFKKRDGEKWFLTTLHISPTQLWVRRLWQCVGRRDLIDMWVSWIYSSALCKHHRALFSLVCSFNTHHLQYQYWYVCLYQIFIQIPGSSGEAFQKEPGHSSWPLHQLPPEVWMCKLIKIEDRSSCTSWSERLMPFEAIVVGNNDFSGWESWDIMGSVD